LTAPAEKDLSQRMAAAQGETVVAMAREGSSLPDIAANAVAFAEAMTQKHRHPRSPSVACKSGCSFCCYQAVSVTAAEAARVARFVEADEKLKAATSPRLKALDAKTRGLTPLQRAQLREPCAFLQDGHCQIYAVRPLACAEFTSYDVESCKREQASGYMHGGVVHEKARLLSYKAVYQGLAAGLARAFPAADPAPLELTAAVLGFLENPALESEWAAGRRDLAPFHFKGSR
jgi:Fe-S-cluster containining protein